MQDLGGSVLEGTRVNAIRDRARLGDSIKQLARRFGVSRNTVRRYLRLRIEPGEQSRVHARRLTQTQLEEAQRDFLADPRRNAAQLHRDLGRSGVVVGVRTLRRIVADLRGRSSSTTTAEGARRGDDGSLRILRAVVRAHRCADPDELESALTLHLAELQRRIRTDAAPSPALVWTALTRKARNWLRSQARRTAHITVAMQPRGDGDVADFAEAVGEADVAPDDRLALERVYPLLRAFDRRVLAALVAAHFNKTLAAQRLGVHRNTVDNALRRVRRELERLGL